MSKNSDARTKLDRLGEAIAKDLDTLSDDELFEEVAATDEERQKTVSHMRNLVESAITDGGRRRLAKARQAYDVREKGRAKVTGLPLDRKKALIAHFAKNPQALPENLTLAARNEANSEADLDSLLEDLLELGAIDDEGNPR